MSFYFEKLFLNHNELELYGSDLVTKSDSGSVVDCEFIFNNTDHTI